MSGRDNPLVLYCTSAVKKRQHLLFGSIIEAGKDGEQTFIARLLQNQNKKKKKGGK